MNTDYRKTALITGVSRKNSIGYGIARRLAGDGINLVLHSFRAYDLRFFSEAEIEGPAEIKKSLENKHIRIELIDRDLSDPEAPQEIMQFTLNAFSNCDILILNHTYDTLIELDDLTAAEIDRHLQVNVRGSLLLIQEFARRFSRGNGGRLIILISGQHLGPMPHPAYVASKGALHQLIPSLSAVLIERGITVNAVNPGATRTYKPDPKVDKAVLGRMPLGRWGTPDDAARLIRWLVSDESEWITGQVINSEGGFRRG